MNIWPKPFPDPEKLKQQLLRLSALDIVLCSEDWLRRYQFFPQWDEGVTMASISNGSGDDMYILFAPEGVIVKGFDHESAMSPHARDDYEVWPGIYEQVPASLLKRLEDEALTKEDVTFCLWREPGDTEWRTGEIANPEQLDDGSDFLLGMIYETAEDYIEWAKDYYEIELPVDAVKSIFQSRTISEKAILKLNPERNAELAVKELGAIGISVKHEIQG
ncbi:hypothetical protein J31TS6_47770 [Brevibacillus reuszeri]|uniref:hypothetical protein n=1 Tax=Brevibacillus reuszeri TaxID=54915 RepID=UPI001B19885F|nr:hypothetical protein [Brevibacillus reuszeri]GIO08749.1 hypothetical protein J31TS6_47770 [Brevibacillus reuszeri]